MQYLQEADAIIEAIADYTKAKTLWLDTEVADYNTTNPRLSLIQVSDDSTDLKGDRVTILDVLDRPKLIDLFIQDIMLNPEIEKVFHNASFDLRLLGKRKAKNVTCTLKMTEKIPYYLVPLPNKKLKTLAEQLCYFPNIDKTEQSGDWGKRPLTEKQLNYAQLDPVYVAAVHHRLLQISQLIEPKPETENIAELTQRYREIEHNWKQLDTEIEHIKNRLKQAMNYQNISELNGFKLSVQNKITKKIDFNELAKIALAENKDYNFSITLTKEIQKQISEIIDRLPIKEEEKNILILRVTEVEADDNISATKIKTDPVRSPIISEENLPF